MHKIVAEGERGDLTQRIADFTVDLEWRRLDETVRRAVKRHFFDTVGVIVAGAAGEIVGQAEHAIGAVRAPGDVPVLGRRRRADILDACYLSATAGHGIELDDGYRQGSVHPAVCVIPAAIYAGLSQRISGESLLEAIVAGYEVMTALAEATHPEIRRRGFHPTGVLGVIGAAVAAAKLRRLEPQAFRNALGLAASSAAGLFSFINGGSDVKRLHAGHAAREGLQAVLLAQAQVAAPPNAIEGRDGLLQAFAFGNATPREVTLPPQVPYRMCDCYIKPYACCRHLQPAVEALITLLDEEAVDPKRIRQIHVETYAISAEHAHTGWDEYASAQLSFPYVLALAAKFRRIKISHFEREVREDPALAALCRLVHIEVAPDLDALYPKLRPARVTVVTDERKYSRQVMEALGSAQVPISDEQVTQKFRELTVPVLGESRSEAVRVRLASIELESDLSGTVEMLAL